MIQAKAIQIFGTVQGVSFRWAARKTAERFSLTGIAQNQPDGSLYIEAEGEPEQLAQFIAWCQNGPSSAQVSEVKVTDISPRHHQDFSIE